MEAVYTVQAFRWCDRDKHSYIVGVFVNEADALACAESEKNDRAGKYGCEVRRWELGQQILSCVLEQSSLTLPLPPLE